MSTIDLRTCKDGDPLTLRNGQVAVYRGRDQERGRDRHLVYVPNMLIWNDVDDGGRVYTSQLTVADSPLDVVALGPPAPPKQPPGPAWEVSSGRYLLGEDSYLEDKLNAGWEVLATATNSPDGGVIVFWKRRKPARKP